MEHYIDNLTLEFIVNKLTLCNIVPENGFISYRKAWNKTIECNLSRENLCVDNDIKYEDHLRDIFKNGNSNDIISSIIASKIDLDTKITIQQFLMTIVSISKINTMYSLVNKNTSELNELKDKIGEINVEIESIKEEIIEEKKSYYDNEPDKLRKIINDIKDNVEKISETIENKIESLEFTCSHISSNVESLQTTSKHDFFELDKKVSILDDKFNLLSCFVNEIPK